MVRALAPGKRWRRPTLRRRLDLTPGSAAKCRPPPGKLVLPIVSTVFGALLIRRLLLQPIVRAWVGKEAEANHGNSSLSETSTHAQAAALTDVPAQRGHRRDVGGLVDDIMSVDASSPCNCTVRVQYAVGAGVRPVPLGDDSASVVAQDGDGGDERNRGGAGEPITRCAGTGQRDGRGEYRCRRRLKTDQVSTGES